MPTITISKIHLLGLPTSNQTYIMSWRKKSDADVEANYHAIPDLTVDSVGNVVGGPYTFPVPDTTIIVKARNKRTCGNGTSKEFFVCEYIPASGDVEGTCPEGYTLSSDKSFCFKVETEAPTPPATGDATIIKTEDDAWNSCGTNIYAPGYNVDGSGTLDAHPLTNPLWMNGTGECNSNFDRNDTDGRMNRAGIWFTPDPGTEWIGFSRTFNVPTAKRYYIGMSADNRFEIRLNGVTLVKNEVTNNFNYWHIYPVDLPAGLNLIEMVAKNDGSAAGMAAEIYDNTLAELVAATVEADLDILFTTRTLVGETADLGDQYGWSCPPGYSLDVSGGPGNFICKRILTTNPS